MQQYSQKYIEGMKRNGASDTEIEKAQTDMAQLMEMYQNFFVRFGMTLMEIVPVGIIVALVSAGLLRKREVLPAQPA